MMGTPQVDENVRFIWATRGRTWGFRFLSYGGFDDPLGEYERAFSELEGVPEGCRRVDRKTVALRFADPDDRRDAAGRVIPHDFVLIGSWADGINTLEDGRPRMWREVANEFKSVWDKTEPPSARR